MADPTSTLPTSRHDVLRAAEIDYRAGILSANAVAQKHGIPESTLRREAKRRGWIRTSSESRRREVAVGLAGEHVANEMASDQVAQVQNDAATQDLADMNRGLAVARKVLEKLLLVVDQIQDPRELKVVIEANRAAIETVRKIRSLDAPSPPPAAQVPSMTVTDGMDKLRAAFDKVLGRSHG